MTQQQQQQEHLPLDTHLIRWPTLGDILGELMLSIEQRAWDQNYDGMDPEQLEEIGDGELESRDPTHEDESLTSNETAIAAAPRLRELLDRTYYSYGLGEYVRGALEDAARNAVHRLEQELTDEERRLLQEVALRSIQGLQTEHETPAS